MWRRRPLRDSYDIVIIGGGVHGLSTAYYLGKLGVTNVAVLDRGYLGGGASARTTAIIRANYLTVEGIPFFRESLGLYEGLARELGFNLLFSQMGRLDLGHTDSAVFGLRQRAEFNRMLGVDSGMVGPAEVKDLVPPIDLREGKPLPITGYRNAPPLPAAGKPSGNVHLPEQLSVPLCPRIPRDPPCQYRPALSSRCDHHNTPKSQPIRSGTIW